MTLAPPLPDTLRHSAFGLFLNVPKIQTSVTLSFLVEYLSAKVELLTKEKKQVQHANAAGGRGVPAKSLYFPLPGGG
jgi:hypothetical protein